MSVFFYYFINCIWHIWYVEGVSETRTYITADTLFFQMTHSLFPMLQRWYIHVNLVIMKSKWRTTFFVRKKKTCYSLCTSVTEFWSHYIKRQIESLLAKLHSIILQQTIVGLAIEYPDRSAILAGPTNTGSTADVLIFFWREMNPMNMWWRLPSAARPGF